jgi:hypothetical protein
MMKMFLALAFMAATFTPAQRASSLSFCGANTKNPR